MILKTSFTILFGLLCFLPISLYGMKKSDLRKSTGQTNTPSSKKNLLRKSTGSTERTFTKENELGKLYCLLVESKKNFFDKEITTRRRKLAVLGIFDFPSPIVIRKEKTANEDSPIKTKEEWIRQVLELNEQTLKS